MNEHRSSHRAKLFFAAELRENRVRHRVTVRNLSTTGALIEINQPLSVGTEIELRRGSAVAAGAIVWTKANEVGVRFDHPIALKVWLPSSSPSDGQSRVDRDVAAVKAGQLPNQATPRTNVLTTADSRERLSEELHYVSRMLERLGDELASDKYVAGRHATGLQNLDIAMQILGHLAVVLNADDPKRAIEQIGMEELRRRLSRRGL